jgi:Leucine-rich repeat (LRR) protein
MNKQVKIKNMNYTGIKHLIRISGILTVCCFMALACNKKTDDPQPEPEPEPNPTISVSPTSVVLPPAGGTQTVEVGSTVSDWSVSSGASWLTVEKISSTSASIAASANMNAQQRTAVVAFTAGTAKASLDVSQSQMSSTQIDSTILVDLYNATGGANWKNKWNLTSPLSQWYGVEVVDGHITKLNLSANNLSGALPENIGELTQLQYCDLHDNQLSGAIPAGLTKCTQIVYLDLSGNMFDSAPSLVALNKLVMLDLSFNELTELPVLNSNLSQLEYLAFKKNRLSGSLPQNWSAYVKLRYVDASENDLSGEIPAVWSSLVQMEALHLYKNRLSGAIPAYFAAFSSLESLALNHNNFTGSIPESLSSLPALNELLLAQNRLTGNIPVSLLAHPHWNAWKPGVCPQQSGYGFGNCDSGPDVQGTVPGSKALPAVNPYKARYWR